MKAKPMTAGDFLRIPLENGTFAYGRVLDDNYAAYYDHFTTEAETGLDVIASKPVLFRVATRRLPGRDKWEVIGRRDLDTELARPVVMFMQDLANPADCVIFDSAGLERKATPQECVGIENAAVWDARNVEDRLLAHFAGRLDPQTERLKVRLPQ
jgi:hypothetical protein